jgi:uncharacterized protein YbjT (DUF2867 family)
MVFHPERTAIVGATGPTGLHLARKLVLRGRDVRVLSRQREHLERVFAGLPVEITTADALDADSLARAVEGLALFAGKAGWEALASQPLFAGPLPLGIRVVPLVHLLGGLGGLLAWLAYRQTARVPGPRAY